MSIEDAIRDTDARIAERQLGGGSLNPPFDLNQGIRRRFLLGCQPARTSRGKWPVDGFALEKGSTT
jgi:hypothetical protein